LPVSSPSYHPPFLLRNGHLNTILPFLFRKNISLSFNREILSTPDSDFLDLDRVQLGNKKCALLVHGLEGSSQSTYILTLSKVLSEIGWDISALNLRGCSGLPNKLYRAYHSGATDDLGLVINKLKSEYQEIIIIGFSLGGNIVLKYAGEMGSNISSEIKAVIGVSVPCHLSSSSDRLEQIENRLYSRRFLSSLKAKLRFKMQLFPTRLEANVFAKIKTIREFDEAYTAPSNAFASAEDYYEKCSSFFVLDKIKVPALLINAQDDPFLSDKCFPFEQAKSNPNLSLYAPKYGGHVGFWPEAKGKSPKHEEWILQFLTKVNCA